MLLGDLLILIRGQVISDARSPFALLANFSPTTLFIVRSMCRYEHSDHQNVPFVLTWGWFVRLTFDVISPNSEDTTEVQWMQHLG